MSWGRPLSGNGTNFGLVLSSEVLKEVFDGGDIQQHLVEGVISYEPWCVDYDAQDFILEHLQLVF